MNAFATNIDLARMTSLGNVIITLANRTPLENLDWIIEPGLGLHLYSNTPSIS